MSLVYLDNAATTQILPEVAEVMQKVMVENFGNPSSTHSFGRKAKVALETARKNIAKNFNVTSGQIVFTSGGTEANNLILKNAVINLGVKTVITSKIEHHAVLNTLAFLEKQYHINVLYVNVDSFGSVNLEHLESLLVKVEGKKLVSLMMVNNEIGNLLSIDAVGKLCKGYDVLFHSDAVQAIGQYEIDLQKTPIDFMVASAHKFHGPKGVGFLYFKKGLVVSSVLHGGGQEKGVRSGTENLPAILGMEKALEISYSNLKKDTRYKNELKKYFISKLLDLDKNIEFNGLSSDVKESSAKILSVRFPVKSRMLLFNLDLLGVAASGGSACQSGANKISHVLKVLLSDVELEKASIRFSFSKFTQKKDLDFVIEKLKKLLK